MTIRECYERMNGNYEDARRRLMSDSLVARFMLKFLQDDSMQQLKTALEDEDYELAFRAVHTLKGVAGNLGFTVLQASASGLTEQLRAEKKAPDAMLVQKLCEDYDLVIKCLQAYQEQHD